MHMAPQYTGLQMLGRALCHIFNDYTHFKVFFPPPPLMLSTRILRQVWVRHQHECAVDLAMAKPPHM